jgi:hypothetical protein
MTKVSVNVVGFRSQKFISYFYITCIHLIHLAVKKTIQRTKLNTENYISILLGGEMVVFNTRQKIMNASLHKLSKTSRILCLFLIVKLLSCIMYCILSEAVH